MKPLLTKWLRALTETTEPGCSACEKGYLRKEALDGYGWVTSHCKCYTEYEDLRDRVTNFNSSGIFPEMLDYYSVDKYEENVITLASLSSFVQGGAKKPWLYLQGNNGSGKTYTAILVALLAITNDQDVFYINAPQLMDDLRPSKEDGGKKLMKYCSEVDFLILDDLGQEKASDWVSERLYIIINNRYMRRKPTVVTSNYSFQELGVKLKHPAILSRLKHLSFSVNFKTTDKRLTKKS